MENDEAKEKESDMQKNDHRIIGKELDLFTFSDLVGSGLPLWTPKGTILRQEIDNFVWSLRLKYGYQKVTIPHITKKELYQTSGHWDKFSEELFHITSREGREYAMKPMNCPHHIQIFERKPHSYREMPQRYAETTMVYRDEQSGEIGGLTRVLSITQDDAHVFCRINQTKEEISHIWDIINDFYSTFGFTLSVRLSFRDPNSMNKYLGTPEIWNQAEKILRDVVIDRKADFFEGLGEATLYGPKLDFVGKSIAGKEVQVATIQLDMNLPERFDLVCINEKGERERIVMIHSAIAGSLERCAVMLIEHYAGNFPLWLSPVQIKVIPVRENHNTMSKTVFDMLRENNIRAELDLADENLGSKVRDAKNNKIPYWIVIGDKEIEADKVTLESRDNGQIGAFSKEEVLEKLTSEIKNKK